MIIFFCKNSDHLWSHVRCARPHIPTWLVRHLLSLVFRFMNCILDLELDSEGTGTGSGSRTSVRRNIALKLKPQSTKSSKGVPKKTKKIVKSGKRELKQVQDVV